MKQKKMFNTYNVLHKKRWNLGALKVYVDPPPITLIKSKNDEKLDKYFGRLNFVGI